MEGMDGLLASCPCLPSRFDIHHHRSLVTRPQLSSSFLRHLRTALHLLLDRIPQTLDIGVVYSLPRPITHATHFARQRSTRSFAPRVNTAIPSLYTPHIHTSPWRQGRRSSSRYCSSDLYIRSRSNVCRSLSSETAGSARPA